MGRNGNGYSTPSGSSQGTAPFNFSTPTIKDGTVSISDTLGGSLGFMSYTDPTE